MSTNTRIPKLFRKPLTEKKFRKKIRARIYVKREQEFIDEILPVGEDGLHRLREELSDEEIKRLRKLAKEIKKNKGLLTTWKVAIIALCIGAILVFNLVFKDALFERLAENNLRRLFHAKVDMVDPHVSLLGGSISFEGLTVADKDSPYKNLFELGHTELSLNLYQVLRGRVIIENAEGREIRFGSKRETSGLLEAGEGEDESGSEAEGSQSDTGSGTADLLQDVGIQSVEELIAGYEERLESPAFIQETNDRLRTTIDSWEERIETTEKRIEELKTDVQNIVEKDPRSFSSVDEAKEYVELLREKQERVRELSEEASALRTELREDTEYVSSFDGRLREVIDTDIDFLQDAMGSFGLDARNAVSSTAEPIIRDALGQSYVYARKALHTAENLRSRSAEQKPAYAQDRGRVGSTVRYPTEQYPRFLLETFSLSFGKEDRGKATEFTVRDIAFDPDEWKRPISLVYRAAPEGRRTDISAELDLRTGTEQPFDAQATLEDYPVRIDDGLSGLSLDSFEARMDNRINLSLETISRGKGSALITLRETDFVFADKGGAVTEALRSIFSEVDTAEFELAFTFEENTIDSLSVETDLDRILRERIGGYLQELADEAAARVERELRAYLRSYLEEHRELQNVIDLYGEDIAGQIREAGSIEELLAAQQEKVQTVVEGKIDEAKERAEEARREAEEEAKKRAEEEKKKLEQERDKQLDKAKDKVKDLF